MAKHFSIRLAWHDNGWNGNICKDPKSNVYCVGQHSYPRGMIGEERNLDWECKEGVKGCPFVGKGEIPPCSYSINAFGKNKSESYATPPSWFSDQAKRKVWELPPSTSCIWPYEDMYSDDVIRKDGVQTYNYDKRLENAKNYFSEFEESKSLLIYYSNYSHPLNQGEEKRYLVLGISRFKSKGELMFYEGVTEEEKKKYAGGFIWQIPITSTYPDEGFKIPYEKYLENPEVLEKITFYAENPRNFKFATRPVNDDDTLSIVERFLEIVNYLISIKDNSENWEERKNWLQSLIVELWQSRGAYPGLVNIAEYLQFNDSIPFIKEAILQGEEEEIRNEFFDLLNGKKNTLRGKEISNVKIEEAQRTWQMKEDVEQKILSDVFVKFAIRSDQMERILSPNRASNNIYSTLEEILENPYIISEEYIGDDIDDGISFSIIDHGMLPSPDIGVYEAVKKDDRRRFRALCVDNLKYQQKDCFVESAVILENINKRLSVLPEWKKHNFAHKIFDVDKGFLESKITIREKEKIRYLYLKTVYSEERLIETHLKKLLNRPDIKLTKPVGDEVWKSYLEIPDNPIKQRKPEEYSMIIDSQLEVCKKIFQKPISVITGSAGTGKTTVIKSLINAIDNVDGTGSSFLLLAPTGKAADRIREQTGKEAVTMHSFLAMNNWLNDNFTLKQSGGKTQGSISTYIIDETSMVDLSLMAAVFNAIDFNSVQRIIFVGDPNQLPPIGRGKVFADVIDWLSKVSPGNIGKLTENVRQRLNIIEDKGNGILALADLYIRKTDEKAKFDTETMLQKIQQGGEIEKDLEVYFWKSTDELEMLMKEKIVKDLEKETNRTLDKSRSWEFRDAVYKEDGKWRPDYFQILSPYRGELFGTDNLNLLFQETLNGWNLERYSSLSGITFDDKVIQIRNRARHRGLNSYNFDTKNTEKIDIFNGELGIARVPPYDFNKLKWSGSRMKRFQVFFKNKDKNAVQYLSESAAEENLELAYAISVHKAQGSDFERVYLVLPKTKKSLLSMELMYTAITRAKSHLTIFAEEDISVFQSLRRFERSSLISINSSLIDFTPIPSELLNPGKWYEEGKIHSTLTEYMVRSKSEVIIANMLFERGIPFKYEDILFAPDGTMYLPDFTITTNGKTYYWEHLGLLDNEKYKEKWEKKKEWYNKYFPDALITSQEEKEFSKKVDDIIKSKFSS